MESICALKDIYKALYQFEKQFSDEYEITINEAMLLCCLKDGKDTTVSCICEYIGLSLPRVSKIVTSMEKKGFVRRSIAKDDHRKMLFKLSNVGKEKVQIMQQSHLDISKLRECMESFIVKKEESLNIE